MPKSIEREETQQLMKQGSQLVEVLPQKQYRQAHIAGAVNLPLQKLNAETAEQLDRQRPVVVYCYDYQ